MHLRLVECPGCGLLYANPSLSFDTLERAYGEASFDSREEAAYASRTYAGALRDVLAFIPRLRSALDIGTGEGAFLERLLELGFTDVVGVEPSRAPIGAARTHIRERIRHGLFEARNFEPGSFSLVTCFQTMEHVPDPLELARGVRSLLEPGGAFAIAVHNRKAVSAKLMGLRSPIFDIEHLQLFCPRTARCLLKRAGFERVRVSVLWNRYPLRYWLRLLPIRPGIKRRALEFAHRSAVGAVAIPLPAGNLMCFGYRPYS
jgi:SAM-dependent methyltransferase